MLTWWQHERSSTETGWGRGWWWVGVWGSLSLDIACFVGGERLIISLSSILQLYVSVAFLVLPSLTRWPSLSSPSVDFILLWVDLFVVSSSLIFFSMVTICFIYPQVPFFLSLYFCFFFVGTSRYLIYLLPATSLVSFLYCLLLPPSPSLLFLPVSIMCIPRFFLSSSFSVSLAMLSTKKVISPLWL